MTRPVARPKAPPRATRADVVARLSLEHPTLELSGIYVVGIRGYYRDGLGKVGQNDRGIYDDAIFVLGPKGLFAAFNANTDPSRVRKGRGKGAAKGMARLKAGVWPAYGLGLHRQQYEALVQSKGEVTVIRDGVDGDYEDTGWFGINIHRGGNTTTGSEGCQTIPPDQWGAFIATVRSGMKGTGQERVTYVLMEGQG